MVILLQHKVLLAREQLSPCQRWFSHSLRLYVILVLSFSPEKCKLILKEDGSSRMLSICVHAQSMTQMFGTGAGHPFVSRDPISALKTIFQTSTRTQPWPVLCQILAALILQLLGRDQFILDIALVWTGCAGRELGFPSKARGSTYYQPWGKQFCGPILGPDFSPGMAAWLCHAFEVRVLCTAWYWHISIQLSQIQRWISQPQKGWGWQRPLEPSGPTLLKQGHSE